MLGGEIKMKITKKTESVDSLKKTKDGSPKGETFKRVLEIISYVSQAMMVVIALWTIVHTTNAWQQERLSKRAYITFLRGDKNLEPLNVINYDAVSKKVDLKINLLLRNIGNNPATDLFLKVYFIDKKSMKIFKYTKTYVSNGLPREVVFDPEIFLSGPDTWEEFFIVLYLDYVDPIINKPFNDYFIQSFTGIKNGSISLHPTVPITKEDENLLLKLIRNYHE